MLPRKTHRPRRHCSPQISNLATMMAWCMSLIKSGDVVSATEYRKVIKPSAHPVDGTCTASFEGSGTPAFMVRLPLETFWLHAFPHVATSMNDSVHQTWLRWVLKLLSN